MSNNQSKASQPALPGFYFDADRGKYFRIQANHIAPQDAKYSRQAVTAERNLKSQQRHDAGRARGSSTRVKTAARKRPKLTTPTTSSTTKPPAAVLPRSSYLDSSCAGAVLQRRLGAVRQQQQSSSAIVKHEWARRVEGRTVFHNNLMSDTFAVGRETGQLFTLCSPPPTTVTASRQQSGPALCVTRPRITAARTAVVATMNTTTNTNTNTINKNSTSNKSAVLQTDHDSPPPPPARTMYPHNLTTFIDECRGRLHRIDAVNNCGGNAIFWLTHQIGPASVPARGRHGVFTSTLRFSRRNHHSDGSGPGWSWTSMTVVGTTGQHSSDAHSTAEVLDMKSNDAGTKLALSNSSLLMVCDIERFIQQGGRHADMTMGRVGGEMHGKKHERMCVEWKGPNVVMTGDRAGRILLSDVRMPAAGVVRARCPWAVSALRNVGQHDNNNNNNINNNNSNSNDGLLAWGLEGGRLFDLRFCKDLDEKHQQQNYYQRRTTTTTRPAIIFDVPPGRRQMRYGMAFDYDAQLGIVASASTDLYKTHRMGLWDVASGRMLLLEPESSGSSTTSLLLVNHRFPQPVTCAQFVDLEHRGGIRSLLTASGRDIVAWDM